MSESTGGLRCSVVTPEGQHLDDAVASVVVPSHDGLLGVLPGHAPMLWRLGMGILRYRDEGGEEHVVLIDRGFGHVRDNEVSILTERVMRPDQISQGYAEEQLREAQVLTAETQEEVEKRNAAISWAKHLATLAELQQ